jgi:hypothetical protein
MLCRIWMIRCCILIVNETTENTEFFDRIDKIVRMNFMDNRVNPVNLV